VLLTAAESEQKLKSKIDGCATREETLQQRIKKKVLKIKEIYYSSLQNTADAIARSF